jgi:hypothetical protein
MDKYQETMGKKIIIGFTIFLIIGLLTGWYFFTREAKYFGTKAFRAVPENGLAIVRIHHLGEYATKSIVNPIWKTYSSFSGIAGFYQDLILVDSLFRMNPELRNTFYNKDLTMTLGGEKDIIASLYILELSSLAEKRKLSGILDNYLDQKGAAIEQVKAGGAKISRYSWQEGRVNRQFYLTFYRGLFIGGTELETIAQAVAQLERPETQKSSIFEKANKTATDNIDINIYLNHNKISQFLQKMLGDTFLQKMIESPTLAEWSEIDLTQKNEELLLNGFSFTGDSLQNYLEIFLNQKPSTFNLACFFPAETSFFLNVSISDNRQFFKDYEQHLDNQGQLTNYKRSLNEIDSTYNINIQDVIINNLEGVAAMVFTQFELATPDENKFLVFKVKSGIKMEQAMLPMVEFVKTAKKKGTAKNEYLFRIDDEAISTIYKLSFSEFGSKVLGGIFSDVATNYYAVYNNCLIMGASQESIVRFLRANVLQETLDKNKKYLEFASGLSDQYNIYFWGSPKNCLPFFKVKINDSVYHELENKWTEIRKIESVGWQVGIENGMAYNMARIKYSAENQNDRTLPEWKSFIGSPSITKLQFVVDPLNKSIHNIVVQDSANNFMLIGSQGRILWKIKLDRPILSEVFQLNCFKDGKLQYFFNTDDALHMLDRDGNYVRNYPLSLRSQATNGVSVFDYDKKGDYRFFVAGKDHRVYLYDKNGNTIPDWDPRKTEHDVLQPIQYFRVENKDYIVFKDSNRGYILDRKGKPRVTIKEDLAFSNNGFYLEAKSGKNPSRLITTGPEGEVVSIGFDGIVNTSSFGRFSANHFFAFEDLDADNKKDYIYLDDNMLIAYDQNGSELFSKKFDQPIFTAPELFQFPDKTKKIGLTMSSQNKLYLLNFDGSIYPGFPLDGNSNFKVEFGDGLNGFFNLITGTPDGYLNKHIIK